MERKTSQKINKYQKIKKQKITFTWLKKAFELDSQGKKLKAAKYYKYLIKNGIKDYRIFSNYGIFLIDMAQHI